MKYSAINWNRMEDDFTKIFWDQNVRQFWVDEEIPLTDDKLDYITLSDEEKYTYERVLGGLTLLDTQQGDIGIPLMSKALNNPHQKSVLSFMGAMEHMHAKSYSSIFSTLCSMDRIDEIFVWIESNDHVQKKANIINKSYESINNKQTLVEAMATSVFLESFLFYSGFFYPLFLSGQGKLMNSGEIINLIIRDEAVHGVYIGILAQQLFSELSMKQQETVYKNIINTLNKLFDNETRYTNELYSTLNLQDQVHTFVQYNADKAMMNLGFDPYFNVDESKVNPIIINGLRTDTKNHDFFSTKGNGYIKSTKVESLKDTDFDF
ncbi:MAG: class 1b ribonucleoside-diphosphate reductase subunit beta [Oscillospiraceae bacterium]|nr:class 1b ribonucleoside-diphosphate reductase subunit beta [Oscillospiraceae bacterium]